MIDFFCVGNPKVLGDSVGPLVGTMLQERITGIHVVGTLDEPVIPMNYEARLGALRRGSFKVVVDASFGKAGTWDLQRGPLVPGSAVLNHKDPIGDISVRCFIGYKLRDLFLCDAEMIHTLADQVTTELEDLYNKYIYNKYIIY